MKSHRAIFSIKSILYRACNFAIFLQLAPSLLAASDFSKSELTSTSSSTVIEIPPHSELTVDKLTTIDPQALYLLDVEGVFQITAIINGGTFKFNRLEDGATPNFGHSTKTVWVKFKVKFDNNSEIPQIDLPIASGEASHSAPTTWHIVPHSSFIERVDYWVIDTNSKIISHTISGWKVPALQRGSSGRRHSLELTVTNNIHTNDSKNSPNFQTQTQTQLNSGLEYTIVMKVRGGYLTDATTSIVSNTTVETANHIDVIYYAFCLGLLAGLLIYNAFTFYATRDPIYLLYVVTVLAAISSILVFDAPAEYWINQTFHISLPQFKYWVYPVYSLLLLVFAVWMIRPHPPILKIRFLLHSQIFLNTVFLLASILFDFRSGFFMELIGLCSLTCMTIVLGVYFYDGYKTIRFLFLASMILLVSAICYRWIDTSSMGSFYYSEKLISLSGFIAMLLFSISLTDRFNSLRKNYVKSLKKMAADLEIKVKERSSLLKQARIDLQGEIREKTAALNLIETQQQKLVYSSKMVSLGDMAGGIAHEINNPLAILHGYTTFLAKPTDKEGGSATTRMERLAEKATEIVERIEAIVQKMEIFSKTSHQSHNNSVVDIPKMIANAILQRKDKAVELNVTIDLNPPPPFTFIFTANSDEIEQIVLALLDNALESATTLEKYSTQAKNSEAPKDLKLQDASVTLKLNIDETKKEWSLAIEDSGSTIPKAIQDQMFDPFFTAKPIGIGPGLGLSMARSLAEGGGGRLKYQEDPKSFVWTTPWTPNRADEQAHRTESKQCSQDIKQTTSIDMCTDHVKGNP